MSPQAESAPVGTRESAPAPARPELSATGLFKTFGGTAALQNADLIVERGQVHALLGINGSGKSTIIKILAGVHQAEAGQIEVSGRRVDATRITPGWSSSAGLRFVHQDTGAFPDHTIAENFALGSSYNRHRTGRINWLALNQRVSRTLHQFELDIAPETRMGDLSQTNRTLVAVARSLEGEEDSSVLILDEPTASLPPHEVEHIYRAIRRYVALGHTVILVSHRTEDVLEVATHATFLRDGRVTGTSQVAKLDEQAIVTAISGGAAVGSDAGASGPSKIEGATREEVVLSVHDLASGAIRCANFELRSGEVLGVSGLAGSGRSSLLRAIAALAPRSRGEVVVGDSVLGPSIDPSRAISKGIVYVPEDRNEDAAFPDRSLRANLLAPRLRQFWRRGRMQVSVEKRVSRQAIEEYGVAAPGSEAVFSMLSGGNQQKVIMARWLQMKPAVVLLDEPTQGVDVGARRALHDQVRSAAAAGVGIVLVSSDTRELALLSDRVIGLANGSTQGELRGDEVTPHACLELAYGFGTESVARPDHRDISNGTEGRKPQ